MAGSYIVSGVSAPAVGKFLTTNAGGNLEWATVAGAPGGLPTQTGHAGHYLTTDGTNASWAAITGVSLGTANGLSLAGQVLSLATAVAGGANGALLGTDKTKLDNTSGTNSGDLTLAAFGLAPSANAASLSGQVLTVQPADFTHPGGISLVDQTMGAGVKSFRVPAATQAVALQVIDDTAGYLRFGDGTAIAGNFVAYVEGRGVSTGGGASVDRTGINFSGIPGFDGLLNAAILLQGFTAAGASLTASPLLEVRDNTTPRLRIMPNGNVGIGMGSAVVPGAPLDLFSASAAGGLLRIRTTSSSGYAEMSLLDSSNNPVGTFGYGNSGAAAPYTSAVYLQAVGKDFKLLSGAAGSTVQFVLTSSTGAAAFTGALTASNLSGTNSGNVTLAAVGSVPNANGASLSTQVLTLQPADATNPGVISLAAQQLGTGNKTIAGNVLPEANGTRQVGSSSLQYLVFNGEGVTRSSTGGALTLTANRANGATAVAFDLNNGTTFSTAGALLVRVLNNGTKVIALDKDGVISQSYTDSTATPGNATINKPLGRCAFAAGANTVTVTNATAIAGCIVHVQAETADATLGTLVVTYPGAGSFAVKNYVGGVLTNLTAATNFSFEVRQTF